MTTTTTEQKFIYTFKVLDLTAFQEILNRMITDMGKESVTANEEDGLISVEYWDVEDHEFIYAWEWLERVFVGKLKIWAID